MNSPDKNSCPFFSLPLPNDMIRVLADLLPIPALFNWKSSAKFFNHHLPLQEVLIKKLKDFLTVKQISCYGENHNCLYLTQSGLVAAKGKNHYGKLGLGDITIADEPTLIPSLCKHRFTKIALGISHSVFLDNKGQVWVCGSNEQGQLGLGKSIHSINEPILLNGLPRMMDIAVGYDFTLLKDENNQVYFFGSNYMDMVNQNKPVIHEPLQINDPLVLVWLTPYFSQNNSILHPQILENLIPKQMSNVNCPSHENTTRRLS